MHHAPFVGWLRGVRFRRGAFPVGELSDHLRRDIGLAPRGPLLRALDRCRHGLPS
jgi:hypothetical protein